MTNLTENAKERIAIQKEKYHKYEREYIETLCFGISECGTISQADLYDLKKYHQCILLHRREQLAETRRYNFYDIEFIDEHGLMVPSPFDDELKVRTHNATYHEIERIELFYYERGTCTQELYSCVPPFEKSFKLLWELYTHLRKTKQPKEWKVIAKLYKQDETILRQEQEIMEFKYENSLLRQERDMYKGLLDDIKKLLLK